MAIMSELDFHINVIEKYNALSCWGYAVVFGLDGRSLLIVGRDHIVPAFYNSDSVVLLNAAYASFSSWFKEYSDSWEEDQVALAAADAAAERANTEAWENSGWLAHEAQDFHEYFKARLDPQSGFYMDF
jgi:hypothetical protein